jgi:hypothetical protein
MEGRKAISILLHFIVSRGTPLNNSNARHYRMVPSGVKVDNPLP